MKGYLYIESDQVVWNPERKPEGEEYLDYYEGEVEQWRENNVVITHNITIMDFYGKKMIGYRLKGWSPNYYTYSFPGTPATISKNTIIKI